MEELLLLFLLLLFLWGFLLLFLAVFQMFDSVTNFDAQSDGERLLERANDPNNQREGRRLKLVTTAKEVDF